MGTWGCQARSSLWDLPEAEARERGETGVGILDSVAEGFLLFSGSAGGGGGRGQRWTQKGRMIGLRVKFTNAFGGDGAVGLLTEIGHASGWSHPDGYWGTPGWDDSRHVPQL